MALAAWVPESVLVVLGCSNSAAKELNQDQCTTDGVPVLKRYGGGGAVVLYPGCVVVSCGVWVDHVYQNDVFFRHLNQAVIDGLGALHPAYKSLGQAGISDIVTGEFKVAGTSMFRSRHYLLYQASVIVDLDIPVVERYLTHPSKEPDYRGGRSHRDFLKGLGELAKVTPQSVCQHLERELPRQIPLQLGSHLVQPKSDEFANLDKRLERAKSEPSGFH